MVQLSLPRFFNAPKFPSSIDHALAPPTPSSSASSSSNVSPITVSEEIDPSISPGGAAAVVDMEMDHANDLVDEAVRPAKRGLFPCLAELVSEVALWGRDAFVAEVIAKKRDDDIPDFSRKYKEGDKDGVIYAIFCLVNGKTYVGQTSNYDARMSAHFRGSGYARSLADAINMHGRANFMSVILLAGIAQKEELNLTEIALIKALHCLAPERGYNLHIGGTGGTFTNETRRKISDWHKGKTLTKEHKENISASKKGKACADKTKAAISATKTGNTFISNEHRLKISESMKKSVVITLVERRVEIVCPSFNDAAKEMGVRRQIIGKLVHQKMAESKGKGGQYAGKLFTARFRD